jgi:sulfur transfer protein SufE
VTEDEEQEQQKQIAGCSRNLHLHLHQLATGAFLFTQLLHFLSLSR